MALLQATGMHWSSTSIAFSDHYSPQAFKKDFYRDFQSSATGFHGRQI